MPDAQGMLPCPGYGQGHLPTLQSMAGLLLWVPVCASQCAGALAALGGPWPAAWGHSGAPASAALQPSLPASCTLSGGTSGAGRAGGRPTAAWSR